MTSSATLIAPPSNRPAPARRDVRAARFVRYGAPGEPPAVEELSGDEALLIEDLYARAAGACQLPLLAVREVVENLVHAEFEGVCVSVFDGGGRLRVSDCGPGIADKARALEPGFSTACERAHALVRGVGCGLPVAVAAMEAAGGTLEIADNLRGGTVVTLHAPDASGGVAPLPAELSEDGRRVMALLVEIAPAAPSTLAKELSIPLGSCGRELVLLEHRGLVCRSDDGGRALTAAGTELLATLF